MRTKFFGNIKIVQTHGRVSLSLAALLLCPIVLPAQNNGVKVSNLMVISGSPGTVTFDVHWDKNTIPSAVSPWSDTVWVFVDYSDNGTMKRLPLLPGATLTETSASGLSWVEYADNNDQGVWVVGNAKSSTAGSFSATVRLLTTVQHIGGACAYGSNYPPVGKYNAATEVEFKGTPPYVLTIESGGSTLPPFSISSSTYALLPGWIVSSFTDATCAPGVFSCVPPAAPVVAKGAFCYGASGALVASAPGTVTIEWYDALTDGTLLHTGEVFSLAPLYNSTVQYYAQAVSENNSNCVSTRIAVHYTVSNCAMSGDCPGYTPGNVGMDTPTAVVCSSFYPGRIGATDYPEACVAFDAGWIGN